MNFKNKKVIIMGLGILGGGVGSVKFFVKRRAKVLVTDLKSKRELKESLDKLKGLPVKYVLGKHRKEDFAGCDLILRNPAVPLNSPYLQIARKNKIPIEMAESLFMKLSPTKDIVAVTGTRGKSTTSALIYKIFQKAGFHTLLGGNMKGTSTLLLLEKTKPSSKIVLELSSWQLQGLGLSKISPRVAVITNIYPDHLNRYKTMKDYIEDKKIIFKYQKRDDYLILNKKNKICRTFLQEAKSKVIWFEASDWPKDWPLKLKGEHNRENASCAYQVAKIYGLEDNLIKKTISSFSGLPHRLEKVLVKNGVTFINDSTSTTPKATISALKTFPRKKIILLAGGNSKNLPLEEMTKEIVKRCKKVILLEGNATANLLKQIQKKEAKLIVSKVYHSLKEALLRAYRESEKGDIILFSPGFTSFAQFRNEFDRGEKFKNEVKALFLKKNKAN